MQDAGYFCLHLCDVQSGVSLFVKCDWRQVAVISCVHSQVCQLIVRCDWRQVAVTSVLCVHSQVCQFLKRGADQTVKNFSGKVSELYFPVIINIILHTHVKT